MRIYEELILLKPDSTDEIIDPIVEQVRQTVTGSGGAIDKVDKWGTRKLAYKVSKYGEGIYVLVQFSAKPEIVKEIERRLRVNDAVLKYITVRIDETLKWLEKRKKMRDKRAARRPQITMPAPAPAPAGAPLPGKPADPAMPGAPVVAAPVAAAPAAETPAEKA